MKRTTSPGISDQLGDIYSKCRCCLNIATYMLTMGTLKWSLLPYSLALIRPYLLILRYRSRCLITEIYTKESQNNKMYILQFAIFLALSPLFMSIIVQRTKYIWLFEVPMTSNIWRFRPDILWETTQYHAVHVIQQTKYINFVRYW